MSDWGKIFEWVFKVMDTKAWIILVVTGVLLYLPESLLPKQALDIRENWGGWVLVLLLLSLGFTLNSLWKWVQRRLNLKNGKKQALENFETLHPVQQMLLLEMFFQRRFTCNLKVNASEVVTLVRYGYLSREGKVTLDSNGDPCVNTTLTPQTIRLMQENREHMQEIRSKLAQDGVGGLPD